ncbi:SPOSA6832_01287, partial [Sporobolomyces salmonicolor]
MLKPLTLPRTSSKSKSGYHALDKPHRDHRVSAGGIRETEVELGDLGNDAFYDECAPRTGGVHPGAIRTFETTLAQLQTKQIYSLSLAEPSERVAISLSQLTSQLAADSTSHKNRIATLGAQVGSDEVRRGHWENLKAALGRAVETWQTIEMGQREKVKEKVARQYRIGTSQGSQPLPSSFVATTPYLRQNAWDRSIAPPQWTRCLRVCLATDAAVQVVVAASSTSSASRLFQQALSGQPRTTDALSALHEANTRRSELRAIEGTLIAEQDGKFGALEATGAALERDLEAGVPQVTAAKIRAAAGRPHEEALCCVGVNSAAPGGSSGDATKTKTKTATSGSAKATQSETATGMATTGAKPAATGFRVWRR